MTTDHQSGDEELIEAIERLSLQLQCLTKAVDDLTNELEWRNNNVEGDGGGSFPSRSDRIISMPIDPTAKDWQINRYSPADLPIEAPASSPPSSVPSTQTNLFD